MISHEFWQNRLGADPQIVVAMTGTVSSAQTKRSIGSDAPRIKRAAPGRSETWKEIPSGDPTVLVWPASIRITPDGKSLAYVFRNEVSELYLVHGLH